MTPKEFLEDHKHHFDCAINDISMREQWSAFGILWEEAQKQPWFNDFVDERLGYRPFVDYGMYHIFIESRNVKPTKFASALKEFLEKLSGEIHEDELVRQNRVKRTTRGRRESRPARREDRNGGRVRMLRDVTRGTAER